MVERSAVATATDALRSRLIEAAPHIIGAGHDTLATMQLLSRLASAVRVEADHSKCWLLMTSVAGVMPTRDELMECYRALELAEPGLEHYAVLRACAGPASINGNFSRSLTIIDHAVVVDVDFSARFGHNTGIQRVVRETVSRWAGSNDFTLVAWTEDGLSMRSLLPEEDARVLDWTSDRILEHSQRSVEDEATVVVPWNSTLVLPEVAQHRVWDRLACLCEFSTNTAVAVGYDAIPVTSAEYVIPTETDRFVRYLSVIKHVDVVVGISESSSEEFAGFSAALRGQGIAGPDVVTVSLPVALASDDRASTLPARTDATPLVVAVGTQEPRKNQLAILAASEVLWQEGLDFELLFLGSAAMPLSIPFDAELDHLHGQGRKASVVRGGSDALLERSLRDAAFSVFVSLHEGYGLPVGESLAAGTPVVATNYGSIAEIAQGGGCLMVDPRSDESIAAAMRTLLTDADALEALRAEAGARSLRTWDDYAGELWRVVAEHPPLVTFEPTTGAIR